MNLVSRRDTEQTVNSLIYQSFFTIEMIGTRFLGLGGEQKHRDRPRYYFDLGSGAGFPGIVWHAWLERKSDGVRTQLIEPRVKRAWFLERVAGLLGFSGLEVSCSRWEQLAEHGGPRVPVEYGSPQILVSMKALRMTDTQILQQLEGDSLKGVNSRKKDVADVLICRFFPAETVLSDQIHATLELGREHWSEGYSSDDFVDAGVGVARSARTDAHQVSILFSRYRWIGRAR